MMHANDREDVHEVYAGDIAAAVGIKQVVTGDTLAAPDKPIKLEAITFDDPVISVAIEPKTKSDQEKMSVALGRLAEEDPTFQVRTNEETGQTEISGMGELHLEVLVDRMMREYKVDANVGRPQVSYRETVRGTAEKIEGRFVRQTGGSGQYGIVYIDIEPAPGEGFDFVNKIKGGSIPTEFIPADREGRRRGARERRPRRLPDGRRARHARRRQVPRHGLVGDRLQDRRLAGASRRRPGAPSRSCWSRCSRSRSSRPRSTWATSSATSTAAAAASTAWSRAATRRSSSAHVPLSEMFGYATDVRSMTQGRATYTMQFDSYEEVPPNIAEKVVEGRTGEPVPA